MQRYDGGHVPSVNIRGHQRIIVKMLRTDNGYGGCLEIHEVNVYVCSCGDPSYQVGAWEKERANLAFIEHKIAALAVAALGIAPSKTEL
jgi:hypothetical protein